MKVSVIVALLGFTSAASLKQCLPCEAVPACPPAPSCGCEVTVGQSGGKSANLGPASRSGSYAALASESAGSTTNIGAQQITIPDKFTVVDQTKVNESCSKGSSSDQSVEIAQRTFDIAGSITVKEKYNSSSKGEECASKEGEGASQTRSRSQVSNNLCAKATIPCTCACAPACGC